MSINTYLKFNKYRDMKENKKMLSVNSGLSVELVLEKRPPMDKIDGGE